MNASRIILRRVAALAAVAAIALAFTGCAKKVTSVDPDFTQPEGVPSADARLALYPDQPVAVQVWNDHAPDGPDTSDRLIRIDLLGRAPGTVHGQILDGTGSGQYEILRREANGGYARLLDYLIQPAGRFLTSHWDVYQFTDGHPLAAPGYIGRGLLSGHVTPQSPLTNAASLGQAALVADMPYLGLSAPTDSNITMKWTPVPGAAYYVMQVYQFTGGSIDLLYSAQPAPLVTTDCRNSFVGLIAAPADSFKIGQRTALVLTQRPLLNAIQYFVRVSAVDANGQLLAFTYGDVELLQQNGSYLLYRVGAAKVTPTRKAP